jgi:hypothetical protein
MWIAEWMVKPAGLTGWSERPTGWPSTSILTRVEAVISEHHVVRVDQEMVLGPGHTRREMGEDQVVPTVQRDQPVGGGEIDPRLPLAGRIGRSVHRRERRHRLSPLIFAGA